jgi:predicted dehydrogenase
VEKPLGVTFDEDQMLRKEVRKHKTVFQFGTQQRSSRDFWTACELVRRGYIGDIKKLNVWAPPSISGGSLKEVPPPATLDYDRWLGPAPKVPYTEARDSNAWWWFIRDYALGFIAGWGIHPMDIALWGAGKQMQCPVTVEGVGSYPTEGLCNTATKWKVALKYESGVEVDFRDAPAHQEWVDRYGPVKSQGLSQQQWLERQKSISGHGTAFEGTEGWICVNRSNLTSSKPAILTEPLKKKRKELYRSTHHMKDFVDSVRNGTDPVSDIDSAVHGDGICHISDIACRLGRKLHWDHKTEQFDNDAEANARLKGAMRAPWSLEG